MNKYLFENHESSDLRAGSARQSQEDIRKNVSIVNGGDRVDMVDCPKCGGSGQTRWGRCFRCQSSKVAGKVTVRSAAASKAVQTARENLREKQARTYGSPEWAYINKRANKGSTFYASFIEKIEQYGELTENQLALVRKDMAKDAEFWASKKAAAPVVPTEAIEALFNQAKVKLAKAPIFRTTEVTINRAAASGRNPGALYVKDTDSGEYLGKIVDGKWQAKWGTKDVTAALQAVASDPTAEAIKYARKFKACCCCGQTLRNPVSVLAVVGPVCGPKWGLDHLRMEAAAMLADEKAAEKEAGL